MKNTDPNLEIRLATTADTALLARIGAKTFAGSFGHMNRPADLARYLETAFSQEAIRNDIEDSRSTYLLARRDGIPVGYAKLYAGAPPDCVRDRKAIELSRIYLDQAAIGKGWGSALMRALIETALEKGHTSIWLGTWKKNPRGIRFYKKWGFAIVGTKTFTVGTDVQDDFIMQKTISPEPVKPT